jgi:hypothetical protein
VAAPLAYPHLNWDWLTPNAHLRDQQNRLGFVIERVRQAPQRDGHSQLEEVLVARVAKRAPFRLVKEVHCAGNR